MIYPTLMSSLPGCSDLSSFIAVKKTPVNIWNLKALSSPSGVEQFQQSGQAQCGHDHIGVPVRSNLPKSPQVATAKYPRVSGTSRDTTRYWMDHQSLGERMSSWLTSAQLPAGFVKYQPGLDVWYEHAQGILIWRTMLHNSCVASQETDSKAFSTPAAAIAEPHGFVMWFILFWRKICDSMPKKKCVCAYHMVE